ncbi:MAG: hypothetical protein RL757_1107, partial [Bacteroidota bacterium]
MRKIIFLFTFLMGAFAVFAQNLDSFSPSNLRNDSTLNQQLIKYKSLLNDAMYQADEKQSLVYAQKISDLNEVFCQLKPDSDTLKAVWGHSILLLGRYYDTTSVSSEAFKCGEKANAIFTDLVKKSPENLDYHLGLALSFCVMSRAIN